MAKRYPIFIGQIKLQEKTLHFVVRENHHSALTDLNTWFFDYFYARQLPVRQLPPLDDWTRSSENPSCWSIAFPDVEWTVILYTEYLEFSR